MRKVAGAVDDLFGTVIKQALALADREDRWADSLVWISDQAIFWAQHAEALAHFRAALEAGKTADAAERAAIRDTRQTMPVGGSTVVVLDQVRKRQ
jgi:hypothetical protein